MIQATDIPQASNPYHMGEHIDDSSELARLDNLRSELLWAPFGPEMVGRLYGVARGIGDERLAALDPGNEVISLMDATRYYATPRQFETGVSETSSPTTIATHNEKYAQLSVDLPGVHSVAKGLNEYMESIGQPMQNPGDAYIASFLHIAAHETGHAVLSGISRFEESVGHHDGNKLATKTYLAEHAEKGVTGNWETDVAIHEERFAEGYGRLVVSQAMATLGYSPEQVQMITDHVGPELKVAVAEGEHQLDHLDKIDGTVNIKTALENTGVDSEKMRVQNQDYLGEIGYSMPLKEEEIVRQLSSLSTQIKSQTLSTYTGKEEDWFRNVRAKQSIDTKRALESLRQARSEHLAVQHKKLGGALIAGFVSTAG